MILIAILSLLFLFHSFCLLKTIFKIVFSTCSYFFTMSEGLLCCWFNGSSFKGFSVVFLLFFLFFDWLKSNHLRSRIERGFLTFFRPIFVTLLQEQYEWQTMQQVLAQKNVQKIKFEAAEMILDPWNQQVCLQRFEPNWLNMSEQFKF